MSHFVVFLLFELLRGFIFHNKITKSKRKYQIFYNLSSSMHHSGGPVSHCVISKYEQSGSVKIDYHCDYDFACRNMASTNAENGVMVVIINCSMNDM